MELNFEAVRARLACVPSVPHAQPELMGSRGGCDKPSRRHGCWSLATRAEYPPWPGVTAVLVSFKPKPVVSMAPNLKWEENSFAKSTPVAFSDVGMELAGCAILGDEKSRPVLDRLFLLLYKLSSAASGVHVRGHAGWAEAVAHRRLGSLPWASPLRV